MASDRNSRLIIVFIVFLVLLNYPMLGIFDQPATAAGTPLLYFYLFFIWLLLIVVVGLIVRNKKQ
jgi:hypothetical protein